MLFSRVVRCVHSRDHECYNAQNGEDTVHLAVLGWPHPRDPTVHLAISWPTAFHLDTLATYINKEEPMVRLTMAFTAALITLTLAGIQAQRQPAGTFHQGKAYRFNKVADGVYHAVGTGALSVVG